MKQATTILFAILTAGALIAQAPLPPNYKTIFENPDLLVMHVHYGAHEFVPMHDHPAVATMFVYLNDSGEVDITHEGPNAFTAQRPPTHTGAYRIAPAMAERHSVTSHSDTDSEFLRVEFKRFPPTDLKQPVRGEAPTSPTPGIHAEFRDAALRVDRIFCAANGPCSVPPTSVRSLLIAIQSTNLQTPTGERHLEAGQVVWLPANSKGPFTLSPAAQCLRVSLLYPE